MSMLVKIWQKWLKFAQVVGVVQMVIALTLVYWLMVVPTALVLRLVSDPLALRWRHRPGWRSCCSQPDMLGSMKRQF